ncbi:MAG: hypothetical protein H6736_22370 [Alphaproteobacteria bacterium]|nr:hypothetical protein [Myxococcales bacterium]MCB9669836.1 hypothetical protein [Alphaproteobacteria bacterium]MCB9694564.1 hypothetical protein [Alphaproteobacteria bacterium]
MNSLIGTLIFLAISAVVASARAQRYAEAFAHPIGSEVCVACGGRDLIQRYPVAWVCTDCGYEQGDGWEHRRQAQHLEQLAALPPEKARERARTQLLDAHLAMLASLTPLQRPVVTEGSGRERQLVINPEILDAARNLTEAFDGIREAALLWPEAGEALRAAQFPTDGRRPDFGALYDVNTVEYASSRLRPAVAQAAQQLDRVNQTLQIAA